MKYDKIIYDVQNQADRVTSAINKKKRLEEEQGVVYDELYGIFQEIEHVHRDYDLLAKIRVAHVVEGVDTEKSGSLKTRYA